MSLNPYVSGLPISILFLGAVISFFIVFIKGGKK